MVLGPLLAPLIDVFLLYGLVFGPTARTVGAWLGVLAIQLACAAYAFRLDREKMTHLISLPLQQILYRQLMYVVLLQSWITALTGSRSCAGRSCAVPVSWAPRPAAPVRPPTRSGGRWDDVHPAGPGPGPATGTPDWVAEGRGTHRAGPVPPEAPDTAPAARAPGRDRYLDLLRTLALGRVVVYHIYGWAWLTIVFPSMGVMFALAGALMARSLKRSAWGVIKGRSYGVCCPRCGCSAR